MTSPPSPPLPSSNVRHTACLATLLLTLVVMTTAVVVGWASFRTFDLNLSAYRVAAALSVFLAALGCVYVLLRPDRNLSALLFAGSFFVSFSAAASVLNYFLLTVAGERIDGTLAAIDRALGVEWVAWMAWCADNPGVNKVLYYTYQSSMPQTLVVMLGLAFTSRGEQIYEVCLAFALAALLTIGIWAIAPSFGAFSVYALPADVTAKLPLVLDEHYARELVRLLEHGPGHITPADAKGLIGFPSFHAGIALIAAWYARSLPFVSKPMFILTALVLVATPIQGGHHVVDVLAAFPVTALAIAMATRVATRCRLGARTRSSD